MQTQLTNFKASVPVEIQAKIKELAEYILNEQNNNSGMVGNKHGTITEATLNGIEGNYVSGWMPRQDGGFSIDQFWQNDLDSSYHFTEKQTDFNNDQNEQCFKAFLHDNGLSDDLTWNDLTEEQQNELANYENDWFEPALLQWQIFVNGFTDWKGEQKLVTLRTSINYKDAPYYREGEAEDIKTTALEIDEFMSMSIEELAEMMKI